MRLKNQFVHCNYPRLIFLLALLFCCLFFVIKTNVFNVCGYSMYPSINNNDVVLVYKTQDVGYGDIIIVKHLNIHLCKRVIGLPGDTVLVTNSCVHINKKKVEEPYLPPWSRNNKFIKVCTLKVGEVFVMGDNRLYSLDSRHFGPVKKNKIVGKAVVKLFGRL